MGSISFDMPDGSTEECIWMDDVKIVSSGREVVCKDQDYADISPTGRQITNPKYLEAMREAVMGASVSEIAKTKRFFRKKIRGVCRFGYKLHEQLSTEQLEQVKAELMVQSPKEVALKWDLSEWFCKNLARNN